MIKNLISFLALLTCLYSTPMCFAAPHGCTEAEVTGTWELTNLRPVNSARVPATYLHQYQRYIFTSDKKARFATSSNTPFDELTLQIVEAAPMTSTFSVDKDGLMTLKMSNGMVQEEMTCTFLEQSLPNAPNSMNRQEVGAGSILLSNFEGKTLVLQRSFRKVSKEEKPVVPAKSTEAQALPVKKPDVQTTEAPIQDGIFKENYPSGKLKSEVNYKNGKREGVFRRYAENGTMVVESIYKDGVFDGPVKNFDPTTGKLVLETTLKAGKVEGTLKQYAPNGKLFMEVFPKDENQSLIKQYYETGEVEMESVIDTPIDSYVSETESEKIQKTAVSVRRFDKNGKEIMMVTNPKSNLPQKTFVKLPASEGLSRAAVQENGKRKTVYVDDQNNTVIDGGYTGGNNFKNGLAFVRLAQTDCFAYVNRSGAEVFSGSEGTGWQFTDGLAPFIKEGKYGFVDKTGKLVVEPKFLFVTNMSNGSFVGAEKMGYKLIRKDAEPVPIPYENVQVTEFHDGMITIRNLSFGFIVQPRPDQMTADEARSGLKMGFISDDGKTVVAPKFSQIQHFHEGFAGVRIGNKSGFINKKGDVVLEPAYEQVGDFSNGLAAVRQDKKWGFINTKGEVVIDFQFKKARRFQEGLAAVSKDDLYGYVNQTGKWVIEPKFNSADSFSDGLAATGVLMPQSFELAGALTKADVLLYGYIDKTGNFLIQPQFYSAKEFSEGLAAVKIADLKAFDERFGFINKEGKLVIPAKFDMVWNFSEGLALVWEDGLVGFVGSDGEFAFEPYKVPLEAEEDATPVPEVSALAAKVQMDEFYKQKSDIARLCQPEDLPGLWELLNVPNAQKNSMVDWMAYARFLTQYQFYVFFPDSKMWHLSANRTGPWPEDNLKMWLLRSDPSKQLMAPEPDSSFEFGKDGEFIMTFKDSKSDVGTTYCVFYTKDATDETNPALSLKAGDLLLTSFNKQNLKILHRQLRKKAF